MKELYDKVSIKCSRLTTRAYSTSFSLGIRCLGKELRDPIYSIYGFVRFADEIVDTFQDYNKKQLLEKFKEDTYRAIEERISTNPILHSFQITANRYNIDRDLIESFLRSMEMDLNNKSYSSEDFKKYILGSAEVVGLMCLKIFCANNEELYTNLKPNAMSLGSAFQKINFLRDLNADYFGMGRTYFPDIDMNNFNDETKKIIEESIILDFHHGYEGIVKLPRSSRFGVYVAYVYYFALFKKIRNTSCDQVLQSRIRIRNRHKARLLAYSYFKHQLNML
jgi:phytoene/squalene synthetase